MMIARPAWLLAVAIVVAAPLAAQAPDKAEPPKNEASKEIVVTGQKTPPPKAVRQATRAITAPAGDQGDQVARFTAPICPQVEGLEDRYGQIVEQRMREDAAAAKISVAKSGCAPNVIVIAVDDGRAVLDALAKSQPSLFDNMPTATRKRLTDGPGPVHVMNLTELRPSFGPKISPASDVASLGKDVPSMQIMQASIIKLATRQDISGSLVLIDKPAMIGKTLRQIADYAVMRAYAMTEVPKDTLPADTILSLFAANGSPPPTLTGFDQAYLRSLYWGPADLGYHQMVGQIAGHINHQNKKAEAPKQP